jgi:DNA-binding MarR family transcriptional regulator
MAGRSSHDDALKAAAEATGCVALRARRLSRLVTRRFEDALRGQEITVAQFTLLGATTLGGPLRPARLARMLDLEKSTLSRNLRVLVAGGLVRIDAPESGGGQLVSVTERGRRALIAALPAWREAQARAMAALGDAGVGRLEGMIAAMGGEEPVPPGGGARVASRGATSKRTSPRPRSSVRPASGDET